MENLQNSVSFDSTYLPAEHHRIMAREMIRKDLELLVLQERLVVTFGEISLYSGRTDEILSLHHAFELAIGRAICEADDFLLGVIIDASIELTFAFKHMRGDVQGYLEELADNLARIIFMMDLSTGYERCACFFLEEMTEIYPDLTWPEYVPRNLEEEEVAAEV